MDIPAHGFFHKVLGDTEAVGQLPQLGAALGHRIVQVVHGNQLEHRPFVRPILVPAAAVHGGVDIVEAACDTVAQLMAQVDRSWMPPSRTVLSMPTQHLPSLSITDMEPLRAIG